MKCSLLSPGTSADKQAYHLDYGEPNLKIEIRDSLSNCAASLLLWYRHTPTYNDRKTAFFGAYQAKSRAYGVELLNLAASELEKMNGGNIDYLIGPFDKGNTWSSYRLVTKSFDSPAFGLESLTNETLPFHLEQASVLEQTGFQSIARYHSSETDCMENFVDDLDGLLQRLSNQGIEISKFNTNDPVSDLKAMYKVSRQAFQNNFLYTPISEEHFIEMYSPLIPLIDSDLVRIARIKNPAVKSNSISTAVGFVFAIPNKHLASGRDKTIILKSLARIPDQNLKGLGLALVGLCHRVASRNGYKKVIHALYKDDNHSASFSSKSGATIIRQYDLFSKALNSNITLDSL